MDVKIEKTEETNLEIRKPFISIRWTIACLAFTANLTQFYNHDSFPVALVAMTNSSEKDGAEEYSKDICPAAINNTYDESSQSDGEFSWSISQQGVILGASPWGFLMVRLFGSRLAERVGQRITVAFSITTAGLMTFLGPLAAQAGPLVFALSRFILGAAYGPIPSSMHSLISVWASRQELSSMVTTILGGSTLGGVLGFLISGVLSENFGWRSIFWVGGTMSLIIVPIWIIVVRNSPEEHPWLSAHERKLLDENRDIQRQKSVPWIKIVTSPYIAICIIAHMARVWLDFLVSVEGPPFFTHKIGLSIQEASFVCGTNYFIMMVFMMFYGRISDWIVNKCWLKKITARKLFHAIGSFTPGLLLIGMAIADCNTVWVISLNLLCGILVDATVCSYFVSVIDLAPNYAGTVMGFFAIGNLGAALNPLITSAFLNQGNGWNKSFYLAAAMNFVSCFTYVAFMTDEVQPWNFPNDRDK